jgi:hypothetical protein
MSVLSFYALSAIHLSFQFVVNYQSLNGLLIRYFENHYLPFCTGTIQIEGRKIGRVFFVTEPMRMNQKQRLVTISLVADY